MRANCSRLGDNFILMPKDYTPAFEGGISRQHLAIVRNSYFRRNGWDGETTGIEQNDKYYLDLTTKSALDTDFKYFTNI